MTDLRSMAAIFLLLSASSPPAARAWTNPAVSSSTIPQRARQSYVVAFSSVTEDDEAIAAAAKNRKEKLSSLTTDLISKLQYRELQTELERKGLPADGTTSQLRARLLEATGGAVNVGDHSSATKAPSMVSLNIPTALLIIALQNPTCCTFFLTYAYLLVYIILGTYTKRARTTTDTKEAKSRACQLY